MKLTELNPQLRSTYRFIPNTPVNSRFTRGLVRAGTGRLKPPAQPEGVSVETVDFADSPGIHIFTPTGGGDGAALLYIHGGGMVIGTPVQDYQLAFDVVRELGITVVLAGYRLAPEHPFPIPVDDCARAWAYLVDHAGERDIDLGRLAIGGQSAGGGIAAMLVQRLHDEGGPQPVAQWLFCPMLDDRTAANRQLDQVKNRLWNNKSNRSGWRAFLNSEPGGDTAPAGSVPARRTNLTGLPAAWIGTGTVELFRGEDVAYSRALAAAGVDVTLDEVPGAPHAFESLAGKTQLAIDYVARARKWLAIQLGSTYTSLPRQPSQK
jgi:acetyl esterase/lipase